METQNTIPVQTETIIPSISPKKPKTLLLIICLLIFLFFASSAAAYYFYQKSHSVVYYTPSTPSKPTATMVTDAPKADSISIDASINWYTKQKEITPPVTITDLTGSDKNVDFSIAKAYEIGKIADGRTIIVVEVQEPGPMPVDLVYLIKSLDNKYSIISVIPSFSLQVYPGSSKVPYNPEKILNLEVPEEITYKNDKYKFNSGFTWTIANELINLNKITETINGTFNIVYDESKDNHSLQKSLYLINKTGYAFSYTPSYDFINEENKITIKLNDGSVSTEWYDIGFKGNCGIQNASIIKANSDLAKNIIKTGEIQGSNYSDKNIYRFTDTSNAILGDIYAAYEMTADYLPTPTKKLSKEEFNKVNSYFLWKDTDNDWQIFINGNYALQAECGKPVIYLYPTKDTQVSVKVGAKITKSEPLYPTNGWTVLAHPNGQLEYQSKIYPNLFWEGLGIGVYPSVKNRGFVVAQKDLVPTIKNHLKKLGLNSQESTDFMEFWQNKLPQSDYVRLTWLNTQEMDILAPLHVSPKPDSIIRIFLDAAPAQKYDKLIPQNLTSIPRNGFTLVEWGGLLLN